MSAPYQIHMSTAGLASESTGKRKATEDLEKPNQPNGEPSPKRQKFIGNGENVGGLNEAEGTEILEDEDVAFEEGADNLLDQSQVPPGSDTPADDDGSDQELIQEDDSVHSDWPDGKTGVQPQAPTGELGQPGIGSQPPGRPLLSNEQLRNQKCKSLLEDQIDYLESTDRGM